MFFLEVAIVRQSDILVGFLSVFDLNHFGFCSFNSLIAQRELQ